MRNMAMIFALLVTTAPISIQASDPQNVHAENGLDYSIPSSSPVKFLAVGEYGKVSFQGRFVMSGTYHYGYITNDPDADSDYGALELYFVPDRAIAARLPYWAQRGRVHEIWFRNQEAFVRSVISSEVIEALKQRKTMSANGRASVVVERYQASVECDYPSYTVSFVALDERGYGLASDALVDQYGC
ncbi:hypothetical protein [Dyella sp. Tek66A03]|uniref:hypothetical protein n=1 Tax=Dyella sp. Tek66A03 TaxID=3458298 RepID=UPI00403E672F